MSDPMKNPKAKQLNMVPIPIANRCKPWKDKLIGDGFKVMYLWATILFINQDNLH